MIRAKGGLTTDRLIHERSDLFSFEDTDKPDIVYLQIGGNDLSDQLLSPTKVAKSIYSFACYLRYGLNIKIVVIGQLLLRNPNKVHKDYNSNVMTVNSTLEHLCKQEFLNIIFWKHHGFWADLKHIHRDGTHVKTSAMKQYFRSVRSAVLHANTALVNIGFDYKYHTLSLLNNFGLSFIMLSKINYIMNIVTNS